MEDKIEELENKIDIIDMKLNELKLIQLTHDNLIKRLNYNFRYDLLKVKTNNKIILKKKTNEDFLKKNKLSSLFIIIFIINIIILINCEYIIFPSFRYIYTQIF